jgi:hypothetical protein
MKRLSNIMSDAIRITAFGSSLPTRYSALF